MSESTASSTGERIAGDNTSETLTGTDEANLIVGYGGNDTIAGEGGNDDIWAGEGNDTITGGAGDDTIWGDAGDDYMTGNAGEDVFAFASGDGNDTISDFNTEEDVLDVSRFGVDSVDELDLTQSGENVILDLTARGGGQITLLGVSLDALGADQFDFERTLSDQRIFGTNEADILYGGDGNDRITARDGNDSIDGEGGNDAISGGAGDDRLVGAAGNDTLWGGEDNDTLEGDTGDDELRGDEGDDQLTGGDGEDTFFFEENSGNDTITDFDVDNDSIDFKEISGVDSFDDLTMTTSGNDTVIDMTEYGAGQITLKDVASSELSADNFEFVEHLHITPTEGTSWMYGEGGNDTLEGNESANKMMGRKGDDTLEGKGGGDTYYGGDGSDTFVIGLNGGGDIITDMEKGADKIDLTAFTAITGFADLTITSKSLFSFEIDLTEHGGGTIELYSHGDAIDMDEIDASDFIFYDDGV